MVLGPNLLSMAGVEVRNMVGRAGLSDPIIGWSSHNRKDIFWEITMLFLTYFELKENMSDQQRLQIADKLNSAKLFPPEGVTIVRWDATPDAWGIVLFEADSAADAFRAIDVWRAAGTGFFSVTKTAPAMPIQDLIPVAAEIQQKLG